MCQPLGAWKNVNPFRGLEIDVLTLWNHVSMAAPRNPKTLVKQRSGRTLRRGFVADNSFHFVVGQYLCGLCVCVHHAMAQHFSLRFRHGTADEHCFAAALSGAECHPTAICMFLVPAPVGGL